MENTFNSYICLNRHSLRYLFIVVLFSLACSCGNRNDSGYSVLKGPFRQSVLETGELQAVNASFLSMPRISYQFGYEFKIIGLADHGKNVHKGDTVIKVDPSSIQKYLIEKQESLQNEQASANKLQVQITNNKQDIKAQLINEEAAFNLKKLGLDRSFYESGSKKRIIELEFRQAEIKFNKIKRKVELTPKIDSLDFRIQQIKVLQKESEVREAREALNKLTIQCPLDGIFEVQENWRTGQTIKVGDAVYLENMVASIPDIRTMKVKGVIGENDISKIRTGMDVIVRLDALPSLPFHGKIIYISKVCTRRDNLIRDTKMVFRTEVAITESDLRLKPGMTVSCEYISFEGEDQLYVNNNCILEENKHFYLFVKKRGSFRKTEVKTGPSNNTYTIVSGDVRQGQSLELPENITTK
jgi:HlyD family secretion protein